MSCQASLRIRDWIGISVTAWSVVITSPSMDPQGIVGLVYSSKGRQNGHENTWQHIRCVHTWVTVFFTVMCVSKLLTWLLCSGLNCTFHVPNHSGSVIWQQSENCPTTLQPRPQNAKNVLRLKYGKVLFKTLANEIIFKQDNVTYELHNPVYNTLPTHCKMKDWHWPNKFSGNKNWKGKWL